MISTKYIKLLDPEHSGTIVKSLGRESFIYKNKQWIRSGILTHYFFPESDLYDRYDEISEEEALKLIESM
ncbi:MAG: hypothetical protein ACYDG2_12965 [Ruminiclostridium sp.]